MDDEEIIMSLRELNLNEFSKVERRFIIRADLGSFRLTPVSRKTAKRIVEKSLYDLPPCVIHDGDVE